MRALVTCALACGALLVGAQALADESQDVVEARARFGQGLRALERNDVDAARVAFAQAYAVIPSVDILWNLAMAEMRTGHDASALNHFGAYADSPDAKPDRCARARDELVPVLFARTAHITVDATPGAVVVVDGVRTLGRAPVTEVIDVEPGHHVVRADAWGRRAEATVDVEPGQFEAVDVTTPVQEPAHGSPAASTVAAKATQKLTPRPPPAAQTVDVASAGADSRPPFFDARRTTAITMSVLAAAAAVGGVVFLATASSDADRVQSLSAEVSQAKLGCSLVDVSPCSDLDAATQARDAHRMLGDSLLGGAAVLAIGAVITYVVWPGAARTLPTVAVAPATRGATAAVSVRF